MTPEQLKASILQLAIQGELVEQRPEEGTAEELYQQIRAEKEALIKARKIKKEKPLDPIKEDEIPFEIPETWKWVRLGEIGAFERGSGIKKTDVADAGCPCVRYGQLYTTYKTRFDKTVSFISPPLYDKCKIARKGDILMALTGENKFDIALAVLYEGDSEIAFGGDMTRLSPLGVCGLYLVAVLNSNYGISRKAMLSTGDIIVHISNDKLANILVPLPPHGEQRRIVARIEDLLPLVEQYGSAYTKLENLNKAFPAALRKSILQEAIQGKLVEQRPEEGTAEELYQQIRAEKQALIKAGKIKKEKPLPPITEDEIPFEIPDTWKWVRLGKIGAFERGSGIKKGDVTDKGYPCVRYGQLYTTYKTRFSDAESFIPAGIYEKCKKSTSGDVLMALTGENKVDIALAVLYEGKQEIAIGGDMSSYTPIEINPMYIVIALNSAYGISCKEKLAKGDLIVHISNDKLASIPIPMPPFAEQERVIGQLMQLASMLGE